MAREFRSVIFVTEILIYKTLSGCTLKYWYYLCYKGLFHQFLIAAKIFHLIWKGFASDSNTNKTKNRNKVPYMICFFIIINLHLTVKVVRLLVGVGWLVVVFFLSFRLRLVTGHTAIKKIRHYSALSVELFNVIWATTSQSENTFCLSVRSSKYVEGF